MSIILMQQKNWFFGIYIYNIYIFIYIHIKNVDVVRGAGGKGGNLLEWPTHIPEREISARLE